MATGADVRRSNSVSDVFDMAFLLGGNSTSRRRRPSRVRPPTLRAGFASVKSWRGILLRGGCCPKRGLRNTGGRGRIGLLVRGAETRLQVPILVVKSLGTLLVQITGPQPRAGKQVTGVPVPGQGLKPVFGRSHV